MNFQLSCTKTCTALANGLGSVTLIKLWLRGTETKMERDGAVS